MTLSERGTTAAASANGENLVWEVLANLWEPNSNPEGYVSLGHAENALMHTELQEFLNSKDLTTQKALTYGDGPAGSKETKNAIAKFFNSHFAPVKHVQPDQLVVTNGVSSAVELTAWALCNPGEGVLLGRPFYRSFLPDIGMRFSVTVAPVAFGDVDPFGEDSVAKYEEALLVSESRGVKIRALLLCHPHNPLGRYYPKRTILGLMRLCQKYKIHLISDEIYSLSVWKNEVDTFDKPLPEFQSVLSIDTTDVIDPSLVHILWGLSKDFGANGIRIGAVISQSNPQFLAAINECTIYTCPSSLAENATIHLLEDTSFLGNYIETSRQRLSESYTRAVRLLRQYGIEYSPGVTAAFFLWANLGKAFLEKHPDMGQSDDVGTVTKVIDQRCMEKKVFVVPGYAAGSEKPGWFRIVFSQPQNIVEEGIRRIAEALS